MLNSLAARESYGRSLAITSTSTRLISLRLNEIDDSRSGLLAPPDGLTAHLDEGCSPTRGLTAIDEMVPTGDIRCRVGGEKSDHIRYFPRPPASLHHHGVFDRLQRRRCG